LLIIVVLFQIFILHFNVHLLFVSKRSPLENKHTQTINT